MRGPSPWLRGWRLGLLISNVVLIALLGGGFLIWGDDILQALLDPKVPYAIYRPPPAPDYAGPKAWALRPGRATPADPPADVFFVHPTTYDGGKQWNGPFDSRKGSAGLARTMLPNYAAPFAKAGRVFAPRYRQASLYTSLTLWDDAIDARQFAYGDVREAFRYYRDHLNAGRPFILVGVEQGGTLAARLLHDEIETDPALKARLVAVYLPETLVPAAEYATGAPTPACAAKAQTGCILAWATVRRSDFGRAQKLLNRSLVWNDKGRLKTLAGRPALCVNPILGMATNAEAPARMNQGAANATDLEWGARPAFLIRQVAAQCENGVLRITRPRSASLRRSGSWAERQKVPGYNVFYADIEADAVGRVAAFEAARTADAAKPSRDR
jgi:hypothetical protein